MKKLTLSSGIALVFAASCGGEQPDPSALTTTTAELKPGPTDKIAALVDHDVIVSDLGDVGAKMVDDNLRNAWGLAFNPKGPAWISANGRGLSQVYDSTGKTLLSVTVPPPKDEMSTSAPTGQVFNDDSSAFKGDLFIFVTEDGTVSGWQPSFAMNAMLRVNTPKDTPSYKGVAIAESHGEKRLYAADFHNAKIDVYDANYHKRFHHPGRFSDPFLPDGFAPFNIVTHDGLLYVSYAKQGPTGDDEAGPGNGFVDVYEPDGDLRQRLISHGVLDSPWGMAFMAADEHGGKDGKHKRAKEQLIVGNFGDGRINVFDLDRRHGRLDADLAGTLGDKATGAPLVLPGLWALVFGPGAGGFDADDLYYTSGPNDEEDGIFGEIHFD
jgi:uncharacterized protein (TIGR03118 family)